MLGCVTAINPDWVLPLIQNGYLDRLHNTLSKFNPEIDDFAVKYLWEARGIGILKLSPRTNMLDLLAAYISISATGDPEHPQALDYRLVINTYPYDFTTEELRELFICLKQILAVKQLTRIHLPLDKLTPQYLKEHFNRFIIYDFNDWLQWHNDALITYKIPLVVCVAPLCYLPGMEDSKDDDKLVAKWASAGFSSVVDLEFIRLADVSVHIPDGYQF